MTTDFAQRNFLQVLNRIVDVQEAELKANLSTIRTARTCLKRAKGDSLTFSISVLSMWSNEGEPSLINHRFTGTIHAAIDDAAKNFKLLAKRNDIQAIWQIKVVFSNGKKPEILISVPHGCWREYTESISRSKLTTS